MTTSRPDDPDHFRAIMGHHPTGVAVLTTMDGGLPFGVTSGSFTSVSLSPPLVGCFMSVTSATLEVIRRADHFCANVMSDEDVELAHRFASRGVDRFGGIEWHLGPTGAPRLATSLAWIDCRLGDVHEVGDHLLVLGRVVAMQSNRSGSPLVHLRGRYARLTPVGD